MLGLPLGGTGAGACALPWEQALLPPSAAAERERRGPPVYQTPQGGIKAPVEVTRPPGVDLVRDLALH